MKKTLARFMTGLIAVTTCMSGCSSEAVNDDKVGNAQAGEVVELEGQEDQYGWFPHMRLTFDGDVLTEVYFDYVDDAGAKKSQDEEYNGTMKEKTGIGVKEAMTILREQLLDTQSPDTVDIVTGATQTSTEFISMAKQAFEQYQDGENSANNYGEGDPTDNEDDKQTDENGVTYENGGDGSPNNVENAANAPGAEGEEGTEGAQASEAPATNE